MPAGHGRVAPVPLARTERLRLRRRPAVPFRRPDVRPARASWRSPGTAGPRATARRPAGRSSRRWRGRRSCGTDVATSVPRASSVTAQRRGRRATPRFISTARLMPSRLGSAIVMFSFSCRCSNSRSTFSRAGDASLWAMTSCSPSSLIVTCLRPASGCPGAISITSSSRAEGDGAETAFRRGERQDAEVQAALQHLDADLPRRHAADVDLDARELPPELLEQRQHDVDRRFVGADEHAPALQVAQVADGGIGLLRQPHQPLRVVEQDAPGFGQLAVLRRTGRTGARRGRPRDA